MLSWWNRQDCFFNKTTNYLWICATFVPIGSYILFISNIDKQYYCTLIQNHDAGLIITTEINNYLFPNVDAGSLSAISIAMAKLRGINSLQPNDGRWWWLMATKIWAYIGSVMTCRRHQAIPWIQYGLIIGRVPHHSQKAMALEMLIKNYH